MKITFFYLSISTFFTWIDARFTPTGLKLEQFTKTSSATMIFATKFLLLFLKIRKEPEPQFVISAPSPGKARRRFPGKYERLPFIIHT